MPHFARVRKAMQQRHLLREEQQERQQDMDDGTLHSD
jgi:hypothetical protein